MLRLVSLSNVQVRTRIKRPNRKLQALRLNAGLSPNALAYRAGVSGNTIRMAEAGFRPSPRTMFVIADVFELKPLDIWPIEEQR
jgi:lambda repressor-like predicted transcriptional regulator